MVRGPANNDLVANEARLLSTLQREVDGKYRAYFPELVAGFRHRDSKDGVMRRVNVLTRLDGFYNLREVREAYPGGVEARSVAWMWRRLLVAVGAAKQAGVVHGCITPDHVLILPEQHGLVLVDWCYGVETGGTISAISPTWRSAYPREVLAKAAVDGGVDVAMAAWTCLWLMGERAPKQLVAFGQGCMMKSPGMRPKDGWEVLSEFNELLERLWGKRKFVPFAMPAGSTGRVG
jgi:hypothetical protein